MKSKESKQNTMDEDANASELNQQDQDNANDIAVEGLPDAETAESGDLEKLEFQLSEAKDKYLRLYSDFDNYKKRINRERDESAISFPCGSLNFRSGAILPTSRPSTGLGAT